jgi:hypothetical protein
MQLNPTVLRGPRSATRAPLAALLSLSAVATGVEAQDALRASLAGQEAAAARRRAIENQVHNIKAGPVELLLRAGLGVEYNSNVRYSNENQADDVILRPMVWTDAHLPVSEVNRLSLSLGLGYAAYLQESNLSYVVIEPGSTVELDLFTGDFRFTVYNRFDYSVDPSLNGAISDTGRYGGLSNLAGVDGLWDLNEVILRLGYGYEIFRSTVDDFNYLDRGTHLVHANASFILDDMFTVGPEATAGINHYQDPILSDGTSVSAGAFVEAVLSEYVTTSLHGGYVHYDFDPVGVPFEDPDVSTWYGRFDWRHRVNPWLSYSISAGREVRLGIYSEYEELWFARWMAEWSILQRTRLRTGLTFEDGRQPAQGYDRGDELVLFLGQEYQRLGVTVGATREIRARLNATLGYRYYHRLDQSGVGVDYDSHVVSLTATYRF